jgi:tetratricopeptide (TPR) repeat protein
MEPAFQLLEQWRQTQSDAPLPLVRQAIILHEQADDAGAFEKLRGAMAMSADRRRANIAFLGARLALQSFLAPKPDLVVDANPLATVHEFLRQCLASDASHPHAQWCLAAVRWLHGEPSALAQQARQMQDAEVADPRYHYVAALCHLLGGNSEAALAAAKRVTDMVGANGSRTMREIVLEAGYVAGLAHLGTGDFTAAIDAFKPMTFNPASPTASYAQAQLAAALFHEERHEEAIGVWQALDPHKRQTWGLSDALAQTTFITALELLQSAKYEEAAERFRQAGRSGVRDRRLGPLLLLALFKAGQQAIYANETAPVNPSLTVGAS